MKPAEKKEKVPTPAPRLELKAELDSISPHAITIAVSVSRPTTVRCAASLPAARMGSTVQSPPTPVKAQTTITLTGVKPRQMYRVVCLAEGTQSSPFTITTVARGRAHVT